MQTSNTFSLLLYALIAGSLFASCTPIDDDYKIDLNRGLYAHYPFSGNADDVTGNGFDGIAKNGAMLTSDRNGLKNSAYYFDGVDDFIWTPVKDMSYSDEASICALIQPDNITSTAYYNICRQGPHPANFLLSFQESGKVLSFGMFTGGSYYELDVAIDAKDYTDGNWHCVSGVYDGAEMRLYVDGTLLGKAAKTGKIEKPGGAYNPIGSMVGRERFKGKIDDVRYYDRAISEMEVRVICGGSGNDDPRLNESVKASKGSL